jgi:hypothetical protein
MSASVAANVIKSRSERRLGTIPYQAATTQSLRLDADGVLAELRVRVRATLTNGGTVPVTVKPYAAFQLLRRIELLINSQRSIIATNGLHLAARQQLETAVRPAGSDAAISTTANAVSNIDYRLRIPLSLPRAVSPWDTSLDMRKVQQAVLLLTWGDATDIFVTPNGAVISAVTCDVEGLFKLNAEGAGLMVRELLHITQDVQATNSDLATLLDRGAYWLRSLNMLTISDNVLVNTMLDSGTIGLRSGAFPFIDRAGAMVRFDQADLLGIPLAERQAGLYRLELPLFGESATNINMAALNADLYARFGVTKVGTVDQIHVGIERVASHP